MSARTIINFAFVAMLGIPLAAMLFVDLPEGPKETAAPMEPAPPRFSRKPCPYCEASSIRIGEELNRCDVCGCEFISAD